MRDFKWRVVEGLRDDPQVAEVFVDSEGRIVVDLHDGRRVYALVEPARYSTWCVHLLSWTSFPEVAVQKILDAPPDG